LFLIPGNKQDVRLHNEREEAVAGTKEDDVALILNCVLVWTNHSGRNSFLAFTCNERFFFFFTVRV